MGDIRLLLEIGNGGIYTIKDFKTNKYDKKTLAIKKHKFVLFNNFLKTKYSRICAKDKNFNKEVFLTCFSVEIFAKKASRRFHRKKFFFLS